jgi:hypothetical protein
MAAVAERRLPGAAAAADQHRGGLRQTQLIGHQARAQVRPVAEPAVTAAPAAAELESARWQAQRLRTGLLLSAEAWIARRTAIGTALGGTTSPGSQLGHHPIRPGGNTPTLAEAGFLSFARKSPNVLLASRCWSQASIPTMPDPNPDPVPSSPEELIARQRCRPAHPCSGETSGSDTVASVLELLRLHGAGNAEKRQIALALLRELESFHDHVVQELADDRQASHAETARWAVQADRLYRARKILETIELP